MQLGPLRAYAHDKNCEHSLSWCRMKLVMSLCRPSASCLRLPMPTFTSLPVSLQEEILGQIVERLDEPRKAGQLLSLCQRSFKPANVRSQTSCSCRAATSLSCDASFIVQSPSESVPKLIELRSSRERCRRIRHSGHSWKTSSWWRRIWER